MNDAITPPINPPIAPLIVLLGLISGQSFLPLNAEPTRYAPTSVNAVVVKAKIKCKYLPLDFVTMRTGGASTEGIKSKNIINKECLKACKENNYYSNIFLMWLRLVYKAFELILFKLKSI